MFLRTMSALLVSGIAFSSLAFAMEDTAEEAAHQTRKIVEEYTQERDRIWSASNPLKRVVGDEGFEPPTLSV